MGLVGYNTYGDNTNKRGDLIFLIYILNGAET
jgi:hypothetical protein